MSVLSDWLSEHYGDGPVLDTDPVWDWMVDHGTPILDGSVTLSDLWQHLADPCWMLWLLREMGVADDPAVASGLLLYVCRCIRDVQIGDSDIGHTQTVWDLLTDSRMRVGVELSDRYAQGEIDRGDLDVARSAVMQVRWCGSDLPLGVHEAYAAVRCAMGCTDGDNVHRYSMAVAAVGRVVQAHRAVWLHGLWWSVAGDEDSNEREYGRDYDCWDVDDRVWDGMDMGEMLSRGIDMDSLWDALQDTTQAAAMSDMADMLRWTIPESVIDAAWQEMAHTLEAHR